MKIIKIFMVGATISLIVGITGYVWVEKLIATEAMTEPGYSNKLLDIEPLGKIYFLNDLVGVSPNREGVPAAFLLKHSSIPYVIESQLFSPARLEPADDWGLSQDPLIKGWGASTELLVVKTSLSLSYINTLLVGQFSGPSRADSKDNPVSIEITIPWDDVTSYANGAVQIESIKSNHGSRFLVHLNGPGTFWMETQPPPSDGFPIEFSLQGIDIADVGIGQRQLAPTSARFQLNTRDLHSIAFGEFNGDKDIEATVVRGGLRGKIDTVAPNARDMVIDFTRNQETTEQLPVLSKLSCRGRQSAWIDVDNDNDLDLYIVCGGHASDGVSTANLLYLTDNGHFTEQAADFGLDIRGGGAFLFVDWDGDQDLDLWWAADDGELVYYQNNGAVYQPVKQFPSAWAGGHRPPQLMLRDIDADMDPDIFLLHPRKSSIIRNDGEEIQLVSPTEYGLPEHARAGVWADINLDGYVDLLTVSRGVYLGNANNTFVNNETKVEGNKFIRDARIVSFAGINGRNFVTATSRCLPGRLCKIRMQALILWRRMIPASIEELIERSRFEPKDWFIHSFSRHDSMGTSREVAFTLEGPPFNPLSVGATLTLSWPQHQEQHWVGEAETSLFSQANYELYASIPKGIAIEGVATWQDGCRHQFTASALTTRVSVARPQECNAVLRMVKPQLVRAKS